MPQDADLAIALDVGGTLIKGGLVTRDGRLVHTERRDTGRENGPEAVVEGILDFAAHLMEVGGPVQAAGVVVPGMVDETTGIASYSANLRWRDLPLRQLLADRTGLPAALGHDVRSGGLAEGRLGAARDVPNFLFLPIGTGVAGAFVVDGVPYSGASGRAGEIGHITVRDNGVLCGCGAYGHLESIISGPGVMRAYAEATGGLTATAAEVAALAEAGDDVALKVWLDAVSALADGLLTGLALFDPGLLVLGGGLSRAGETLFAPLREMLAERATFHRIPTIVPAKLGDEAGCLGAGLMAWDALL